jgi:hypothetical protein
MARFESAPGFEAHRSRQSPSPAKRWRDRGKTGSTRPICVKKAVTSAEGPTGINAMLNVMHVAGVLDADLALQLTDARWFGPPLPPIPTRAPPTLLWGAVHGQQVFGPRKLCGSGMAAARRGLTAA